MKPIKCFVFFLTFFSLMSFSMAQEAKSDTRAVDHIMEMKNRFWKNIFCFEQDQERFLSTQRKPCSFESANRSFSEGSFNSKNMEEDGKVYSE